MIIEIFNSNKFEQNIIYEHMKDTQPRTVINVMIIWSKININTIINMLMFIINPEIFLMYQFNQKTRYIGTQPQWQQSDG